MASAADNWRRGCFSTALTPAAANGSAGISQRYWTIQLISTLQRIHLVHIRGLVVAVNGDNQCQPNGGFGCRHTNRKQHEENSGEQLRVGAVSPERNEVQVRRIEH